MRTGFVAAILAISAAAAPVASAPKQADIARERAALQSVIASSPSKPDNPAVAAALKPVVADPAFAALSEEERHAGYLLYGSALFDIKDWDGARAPLRAATALPEAGSFDWDLRFQNAFALHDHAESAVALAHIAQSWPDKIANYRDIAYFDIVRALDKLPAASDQLGQMLEAFHAMHWKPAEPFADASAMWLDLMRLRLARGDLAGAAALAGDIINPTVLIRMRADRRFDAVVAGDPARFDVMKRTAAQLADFQARMDAAPDQLEPINQAAHLLYRLGRVKESLAMLDGALAQAKTRPQPFTDYSGQIGLTRMRRAATLFASGKSDDALEAMAEGMPRQGGAKGDVVRAIDLGGTYDLYDRPKDALAAVGAFEDKDVNDYGRMALYAVRACAFSALGDSENLAKAVAYMKAHASDALQPYFDTLLCTGDLDGAANAIIAALDDPGRRSDMLVYLQDYQPPAHESAKETARRAALLSVRNRPEVAAAIAKVGRIDSYAMTRPFF